MKLDATFVRSAVAAADFPRDGTPQIALVGRSNVGKSTLINALVRQRVARTSAAPGKTRQANIYRVARGAGPALYLVDLPGYGYARGGAPSTREFDELTRSYFGRERQEGRDLAALLLVDCRHPGLASDRQAWQWLNESVERAAIVATKIDKLARGERIRALRQLESVFDSVVVPVSAATGEGMDELWNLIDRLAKPPHRNNNSSSLPRRNQTARPRPLRKR